MRRAVILISVLALALAPVGCKEGDSIGGGIAPATADFLSDPRDASIVSDYVSLRTKSIDGGKIVLEIVISEVADDVMALAMKLDYPEEFSKFIGCADGGLLVPPGECEAQETEVAGEVLISRNTDKNNAAPVAGDQVIVSVEFLVFGAGQGQIEIVGPNLGGGETTALLDDELNIIFVDWFSGTLVGE